MSSNQTNYGTSKIASELIVYIDETGAVPVGAAVCYDRSNSTVDKRNHYCKKPTLANINDLAGVVADQGKHVFAGPQDMAIIPLDNGISRGVQVLTDENCVVGDFLGPIPGSYYWGKCVTGQAFFRCTEAVDGTTTPALVKGDFGFAVSNHPDFKHKVVEFFDHFLGDKLAVAAAASAVADNQTYLLTGTTATTTFRDSLNAEAASAALKAAGVLSLIQNGTNECSITLNGEPFGIPAGSALFFEARLNVADISTGTVLIGLGITDVAMATHADFIGFKITDVTGAITCLFQKGAGGEVTVTPSPAVAAVNLTYITLSILVRNRAAAVGKKDIYFFINEALVAYTNSDTDRAEIPDTESLTLVANIDTGSGGILNLDRWTVRNYIN